MDFTPALRDEYRELFASAKVRPARKAIIQRTVDGLLAHKDRYKLVGGPLQIPWWVVAIIHQLEASGSFHTHLHNGDPLTARTVHVPRGRPTGRPPFTWEDSAKDALVFDRLAHVPDWSVSHTLYRLERFNGFGYRPHHIPSPYLWSFCQHYVRGKFGSDGHFDPALVSQQCGAAVLLRVMVDQGHATVLSASAHV